MRAEVIRRFIIGILAGGALAGGTVFTGFLQAEPTFGFSGMEIFPIDPMISNLRCADLDGDGRNDLVVANNSRSKIVILYNQTGRTNPAVVAAGKREINELPPDARFRLESIASEKRIADLVVADLNNDQRPDLAYYGDPKELVVQYNQGGGQWSAPKRWTVEDGLHLPNCLAAEDLNGDGLTDLLLLGENALRLYVQKRDQTLAEPELLAFSGALKSVQALDINGDGRQDLLLSNWDTPTPLRFRLQNQSGRFGPEIYFTLPPIRSYWADDLDGDRQVEIITITQNSGRAQSHRLGARPPEKLGGRFAFGQFNVLPLVKTGKAKRGLTWGDVNGDQRPDLLVAEPDSGQLTIFLQQADGSLAGGKSFPTLTGVSELSVADWDGDGRPEIFLLSAEEGRVGLTRYETEGKVAFPALLPLEGKPLAMTVARLSSQGVLRLALLLDQDGKRSLVIRSAAGLVQAQPLADTFKSNPNVLAAHDADQDGLTDLVVLVPYEKIKILRQSAPNKFEELDVPAPGGNAEQPWLTRADVDGDGREELLLAQKNFLRAVVLKADENGPGEARGKWSFAVREQINGAGANSRLVGAAALPNQSAAQPSFFLLDAERKVLTLCERDQAGVWQVQRNLPLPFTEFASLQPLALGATNANCVAFAGLNAVAWLSLAGQVWEMKELDGYESPLKDGRLHDVISGDLNQDRRKDLVFLETSKNYLEIVTFGKDGKLTPANRWQVFEERTFRGRRSDVPEPREALIADFTGDGKADLVIMVHDRLLLYPQE